MNGLFLRHFLEFLIILPSAVLALLPVRKHLRVSGKLLAVVLPPLLGAVSALSSYICVRTGLSSLVFIPVIAVCFLLYLSVCEYSADKVLFCFLNACMLSGFATLYANYLAAPIEEDPEIFSLRGALICLALAVLNIPVFLWTLAVELPDLLKEDRLTINWLQLSVIPLVLTAVFIWAVPNDMDLVMQGRIRGIILTVMLLFPLAVLLIYHFCWEATMQLAQATRLEEENNLLQMEQKRYEQLRAYMDETKVLRHDFRQHLLVLGQLSSEGKTEELDDYILQLTEQTGREHPRYCANAAVDAIAARYADLTGEQGIRIDWMLEVGETLRIREADMCAILGNLLENAIRAVREEAEEKRWIKVYARMLSDAMLGISVDNPCSSPVEMNEGFPVVKKKGHGLGLISVAATVRQYGGNMEISADDGIFSVDILFCFR